MDSKRLEWGHYKTITKAFKGGFKKAMLKAFKRLLTKTAQKQPGKQASSQAHTALSYLFNGTGWDPPVKVSQNFTVPFSWSAVPHLAFVWPWGPYMASYMALGPYRAL